MLRLQGLAVGYCCKGFRTLVSWGLRFHGVGILTFVTLNPKTWEVSPANVGRGTRRFHVVALSLREVETRA